VSQGWAGTAFGMITIPRIGQEVLVSFWEGNPDEPVIVGRVYNNKTRVPYKLPDEKTKSTWKSHSTPNSTGSNEIMFEDKAGKELVFVQAERDLSKLVKHNETERTGASRTVVVGANRSSVIGAIDTTLVGAKYSLVMATPKALHIEKMGEPDVEPLATMIEMIDNKITLTTGKATVVLDGPTITLKADGDIKIGAGGEVVIHGGPFVKINC
jgi:type VI secretion system secreted protein VgrG